MIDLAAVRAFLEPRHHGLAASLGELAARVVEPLPEPAGDDEARVQARELLDRLGGAGCYRPILEQDLRALCLVREVMAGASPLADAVVALQALAMVPLLLAGDEPLQQAWLEPAGRGAAMGAFAMTEREAGSDVRSMRTRARRDGDVYVLDGAKSFISNAGIADFYVVFAQTGEPGSGEISAFVLGAATSGLRYLGPQVLASPHPLGEIALEGCRVPAACRLGVEGEGFKIGMMTLDRLRPTVAAAACGMASRALQEALAHAESRHQFGRRLADFQLVQDKIARMAIDLDAARLLTYRAAWENDLGKERITLEAAMAKAHATEAAQRIVDQAIQVLGGRGVLADHPLDRLYRSVRALRIYEGTTEIQHLLIAGLIRKSRGAPGPGPEPERT